MVEWAIETCRREMLINQSTVFGCYVCVDWIATDQMAQRGDAGQIICKLRNNFRIATVMWFTKTPADCAVTRPAAVSATLFCATHRSDLCTIFSIYDEQWIQSVKRVTALKKRQGSP
jgi:hypothetical protein